MAAWLTAVRRTDGVECLPDDVPPATARITSRGRAVGLTVLLRSIPRAAARICRRHGLSDPDCRANKAVSGVRCHVMKLALIRELPAET